MASQQLSGTPLDERVSAVDSMVAQIRTLIREGGLRIGDALPSEVELSSRFAASRNTVREAIRTLKAYGIIESRQNVGAVITDHRQTAVMDMFSFALDISVDTFRQVQGFRRLIEVNVGDALISATDDSFIERAAKINSEIASASDAKEASRLDYDFHRVLIDAFGNRTLSDVYTVLQPVICNIMELGKTRRVALGKAENEHAGLLDALRTKDRLAFAYRMNRHLDTGLEYIPVKTDGAANATLADSTASDK